MPNWRSRKQIFCVMYANDMKPWLRMFVLLLVAPAWASALPDADTVLKRVQERMKAVCADSPTNKFHYTRTNIIEELDGSGKLEKRVVKTYVVRLAQGLPVARLVALDGRRLSESEQR